LTRNGLSSKIKNNIGEISFNAPSLESCKCLLKLIHGGTVMKLTILLLTLLFFLIHIPVSATEPVAGVIKNTTGKASIERDASTQPATAGMKIHVKDALNTGPEGTMGVIFRDDTTLSLGPDTRIVIDEFLFSPAEGKLGFVSKISKGTAAYLSGQINKLSPGATRVETPLAVLGIRGTRFLIEVE
jgi:hypothetical protein